MCGVIRRLLVAAIVLASIGEVHAQDERIVRKWQGSMGGSQFGVFTKDGKRIVYAQNNDVVVADTVTGDNEIKLAGHTKPVWLARFSPDDKRVVSVSQDGFVKVWDLATKETVSSISTNAAARSSVLVTSRDAKLIALSSAENRQLKILNTIKGAEAGRLSLTENEVTWTSVTPDLKYGMSGGIRNQMRIWNIANETSIELDNGHHNYCGQFTHDGQYAVLGGAFNWDLWDLGKKAKIKSGTVSGGHVYAVATSPNTSRFITGLSDGSVWVWDIKTGVDLATMRGHTKPVGAAMIPPTRSMLSHATT